jgi:glycosyltransferase involved in cell wall biosynthesis
LVSNGYSEIASRIQLTKELFSVRVLQVSCIVGQLQRPLAQCLADRVGEANFRFAATSSPSLQRRNLGWNFDDEESWILRVSERPADRKQFQRWWDEADVVLCGDRLFDRMKERLSNTKLTFYMSERWWKPPIGMARLLHPRFALMTAQFRQLASSPLFHFLPMGGYAAADMRRITPFIGRMWSWGYFTMTPDPLPACDREGKGFRVLWAGRMLGWKRIDTLIKAFRRLLTERPDATLTVVGRGPEQGRLEQLAEKLLAAGSYHFLPAMPAPEILRLMRQHHVYVLPSDGYEGWGAVVNEAMAEGCAVLASEAAGAAKTMIQHGLNGLLFTPGDSNGLGELLCEVGMDEALRVRLAQEGQRTVVQRWSPAVAAERFISVCDSLLAKKPVPTFNDGPMAPA